jgi:hypothetical protein
VTERKLFLVDSVFLLALALVRFFAAGNQTQSSTQYLWCNDPLHTVVFLGNKVDFFR